MINYIINAALYDAVDALKTDLINSIQANSKPTTNQAAKQITITKANRKVQLNLPAYLIFLEKGRGPTGKNAIVGNPPMIRRIQQWCKEKGIPDKAAWAIKKKIDKTGYVGKPGILSEPLSDSNIDSKLEQPLNTIADFITAQLLMH